MKNLIEKLENKQCKIAVLGLGYVGIQLANAFSRKFSVIGFDTDSDKILKYKNGIDPTLEVGDDAIKTSGIFFSCEEKHLNDADIFIVAVPTPVNDDNTMDLSIVTKASAMVAKYLKKGNLVVYESTVYPGVTEEICKPILEENSSLKCPEQFFIGYSPERINPGDKIHKLSNICKIVSGVNEETALFLQDLYENVIDREKGGEIYKTPSIKIAEAAKIVENSQRDANIAFINEIAQIMHKIDIDTIEVIKAMNTKWNSLGFVPGLVGGHCISVDPYYLIQQAERFKYAPQLLSTSRNINEGMSTYVCSSIVHQLVLSNSVPRDTEIVMMGVTFKENCNDLRNSKAIDVTNNLKKYNYNISICEPNVEALKIVELCKEKVITLSDIKNVDCLVFSVAHDEFKSFDVDMLKNMFKKDGSKLIIDIVNIFDRNTIEKAGFRYWCL